MKRLVAIVLIASIVAAAGIGIGLASFTKPQKQDEQSAIHDVPAITQNDNGTGDENIATTPINATQQEMVRNEFLKAGWPEESARVFSSIKTEFREGNSTYVHYVQTLPSGMLNDVKISISPGEKYTPVEADKIFTQFGSVMYLKDAKSFTTSDIFATKTSYFIPYDSLDPELVKELGWGDPFSQVSALQLPGMQYASAATETTGVGVGSENTLIRSSDSSGASDINSRLANAEQDIANMYQQEQFNSRFQEGGEIWNANPDDPVVREVNARLTSEAQSLAREQAEHLSQETRQMINEIRTQQELAASTKITQKWLVRVTGLAGVGLAGFEMYEIKQQDDTRNTWLSYYEDCVRNPDIPRYGGDDDPGYVQSLDQIETARNNLRGNTGAMYRASVLNTGAGLAAHNPAMDILTMLASSAEQAMLDHVAQDEMAPLEQMDTPCRAQTPCEEPDQQPTLPPTQYGDHTPGPDEPGFYYTIGPRESYEPPERQICKPPEPNSVRITLRVIENLGEYLVHEKTFEANTTATNLIPFGNTGSMVEVRDYHGNGTGLYHETAEYIDQNCPTTILRQGNALMNVDIRIDENSTSKAEVDVAIAAENLSRSDSNPDPNCNIYTGVSDGNDEGISCVFLDVNVSGGYYRDQGYYDDSDEDDHRAFKCELVMGPLSDVPP